MSLRGTGFVKKLRRTGGWIAGLRSYDPAARRVRRRGPAGIQIQTIDRCNGACLMCPYSSTARSGPANLMSEDLYLHVLGQIRQAASARTVLLMLQNEPLLDRTFVRRVRLAKEALPPAVRVGTVTNGAPLTPSLIEELARSGIDTVMVSIDAIKEDTFNRIRPGLNFARVVNNTLALAERLGTRRVAAKFLRLSDNAGEEREFARFWSRHGIPTIVSEACNRAGSLDDYERVRRGDSPLWKKLTHPILNRFMPVCPLPFNSLGVLWDGRVILCCNDWAPRETVGDLTKQNLPEVWNGEKINHHRHLLWTHRAAESSICADCNLSDRFWKA